VPVYQSPLYALAATTQHDWQFWKHMQLRRMPARFTKADIYRYPDLVQEHEHDLHANLSLSFSPCECLDHRLVNLLAFGRIQSSIPALQHAQQLNSILSIRTRRRNRTPVSRAKNSVDEAASSWSLDLEDSTSSSSVIVAKMNTPPIIRPLGCLLRGRLVRLSTL